MDKGYVMHLLVRLNIINFLSVTAGCRQSVYPCC